LTIVSVKWAGVNVAPPDFSTTIDSPRTINVSCRAFPVKLLIKDVLRLPAVGATVSVTFANQTSTTIGVNSDGEANLGLIPLESYTADISFLGQRAQIKGDASKESITMVRILFGPFTIAGIFVVVVVIVVVFAVIRRKNFRRSVGVTKKQVVSPAEGVSEARMGLEREKVATMLSQLEEKYRKGEIDEETYTRLKAKYESQLN
ncbi:MAG: SHOCT domain-containing protein, partial [Nitrososphaerales archaeon]